MCLSYASFTRTILLRSAPHSGLVRSSDGRQGTALSGYVQGAYVKITLTSIPKEFVEYFKPQMPVIIGGVPMQERGLQLLRCRMKKHRWYKKILKNNDPLIFSVGWRRFQSIPLFSRRDENRRNRLLKYTPEVINYIVYM